MKKLIFTLISLSFLNFMQAQNPAAAPTKSTNLRDLPNGVNSDKGALVPEIVKINFDKTYPNNIAAWSIEDKKFMAEYKDSLHIGHIIVYDQYGTQLSKQEELSPGAFPAPIDKYIADHYPNQKFTVWSMVNADETNLYYFTRTSETIWFDPTGKFRNKTKNNLK